MRIGLFAYTGCMPAGLFAFADMLNAANRRGGRQLFDARFVALQAGTITCAHGATLDVARAFDPRQLDAVLIPGFWAESTQQVVDAIAMQQTLVGVLSQSPKSLRTWAYCTGVALLAASGRLDGQPATITWWLAESMVRDHPDVDWRFDQDMVAAPGAVTAGGVNGHYQIVQTLVDQHVSPEVSRDLAALMVLPRPIQPHPAFRAMSLISQQSPLLRRLHALVERLPAERITMKILADQLAMSERTLARKVDQDAGMAIASYARRIKLNQVSERLMLTSASVGSISEELGFSSESNLRRMFKALTRMTPLEYRQRFSRRFS